MNLKQRVEELTVVSLVAVLLLGPVVLPVLRAVVNLPVSAVALVWGKAHGGQCTATRDLTVACAGMDGGFSNQGTTVGNVWLYEDKGGPSRQRHETKHSSEWALFGGGPTFPLLYAAEHVRAGDIRRSVFERWAGLDDGGWGGLPAD